MSKKLLAKEIRLVLYARELVKKKAVQKENERRAKQISIVDQSKYVVKIDSIECYILKFLSAIDEPAHIIRIINEIEKLGWKTTSKYHKYKQVLNALCKNDYMFFRCGDGMFKLCEGFKGHKPIDIAPLAKRERPAKLTRIKDVVAGVVKNYQSDKGISAAHVYYIMTQMGFKCSATSIYRAMQSNEFIKENSWYKLNDLCKGPEETKS